jgi:DNA-binding NtrC family response regulator
MKIDAAAQEKLMAYSWPGNVRELQHTIERAIILCESNVLKPDDFLLINKSSASPNNQPNTLDEMEEIMINRVLNENNSNLSAAANQLGVSRQTLYNKIKKRKSNG